MKNAGHGEKTVHFVAAVLFFAVSLFFIVFPQTFSIWLGFVILFALLGLKTIGNIVVDSHNVMHYHSKK